ncbi:response regulator [Candidatus Electronema sp. TJ]|uniref:response regulator n=1 Tax=Candidatus Electronema sp. TJ TaxID=3401573 RepID=UPI003AA8457B
MKLLLIVDDEPELLLSIKSGFEHNGRFRILTAENGRDALELLDRNKVDLVVTDLRMPVMDGIELLSVMSESFPEVPHIVMTAFGTPLIEKQLKRAGAIEVLEKPLDIEALEQAVSRALDVHEGQSRSLSGLALSSFLQLVAMEEKTVHIKVFHPSGRNGSLFFRQGELIDAEADQLVGDEAALEMLSWENARVSMKEFPSPAPGTRMQSELLPLLFTAAKREEEHGSEDFSNPLEAARLELSRLEGVRNNNQQTTRQTDLTTTLTGGTMGLKDLLKKMADDLDGVLAIQVTGMDGITLALHNPSGTDVEAFSAKFAMVMKLVEKSAESLKGLGELEENLVQTKNAWVLTRFITPQHYLGIAVSREGTLGNVRLISLRYIEHIRKLLAKPE